MIETNLTCSKIEPIEKYQKIYEKVNQSYSDDEFFSSVQCDLCLNTIYCIDEFCHFKSTQDCFIYIIYILSLYSKIVYYKGNPAEVISSLSKCVLQHKNINESRSICKVCMLKLINHSSILQVIVKIFSPKKNKEDVLESLKEFKKNFFVEDDISNLRNHIKVIIINLKELILFISKNKDENFIKKVGNVKEEIRKKYDICKFWLHELVLLFLRLNLKIQSVESYIKVRKEFEDLSKYNDEINILLFQNNQMCSIIKNFSEVLDTC